MKKVVMAILLSVALQGAIPVHAISMPSFRMPSVSYEAAKERLQAAKDRVVKAMKTNKKAAITAAVGALFIALAVFATAKRRGQQAQSGVVYPSPVQEQEVFEEVVPSKGEEEEYFSAEEVQDQPLPPAISQEDIMRASAGFMGRSPGSPASPRTSPRSESPTGVPSRYGIYSSK